MIDATHLQKSFDDHTVLHDASLSVEAGTVAALVGPNGSGKTTTLHVLAGLTTPDDGTATVAGTEVTTNRTAAQEQIAFLPQDVRFHDALTPRQVLRFYATVRPERREEGISGPRPERREEGVSGPRSAQEPEGGSPTDRIDALLADVALMEAADKPCDTLSGGMRQRLGIAVLELAEAPVLLLDEPALSLDPEWRTFLMDRLRAHADNGAAVVLATHLLDTWRPIVDRVLRCADGTITDAAPAAPTTERPQAHAQPEP